MHLRVATYNIRKCVGLDWRRRPDRILAVLAELRADVVTLQEADRRFGTRTSTLPAEALLEAGWRPAPVAPHRDGLGWRGNAILLGARVMLETSEAIHLPALEPRGGAMADLATPWGRLRVIGVHLGLTFQHRTHQAVRIVEMVSL